MRHPVLTLLLLVALTTGASAEPKLLSDGDLRNVAGGFMDTYIIMPTVVINNETNSAAIATGSNNVQSTAISNIDVQNVITLNPSDQVVTIQPGALPNGAALPPSAFLPASRAGNPGAVSQPPVWVPWARQLRGSFGPAIVR